MSDRSAYIFVGSKRPGDTTVALQHHDQFVPCGEQILLSAEDFERLSPDYDLRPVEAKIDHIVFPPPKIATTSGTVATTTTEPPTASVARSTIPVKPSSDDESPNAAL